jgi:hypothetical protein
MHDCINESNFYENTPSLSSLPPGEGKESSSYLMGEPLIHLPSLDGRDRGRVKKQCLYPFP